MRRELEDVLRGEERARVPPSTHALIGKATRPLSAAGSLFRHTRRL